MSLAGPRQEQEQEQGAKAPPPVTLSVSVLAKAREKEKNFEVKNMRKKKQRSKKLDVAKKMPPLYHTLPGKAFSLEESEVLEWLSSQGELQLWLFNQLSYAGYIEYDPETGLWSGIEC